MDPPGEFLAVSGNAPMPINSRPFRGLIRPKISTMPRQKTEATAYLNIYKLTVEKTRLQEEVKHMEERKAQILQRLDCINQEVAALKGAIAQDGDTPTPTQTSTPHRLSPSSGKDPNTGFETFYLEY